MKTRFIVALCACALAALASVVLAQPNMWTVNGSAMPLSEFIEQVAEITGKTVVVDPRVKDQQVTVVSSVGLDTDGIYELFLTVLRVHKLGAVETNGVVSVVQQVAVKQAAGPVTGVEDHPADLLVTRVVPLAYVRSSDVVKMMRPLIPGSGHIAAIDKPNVLIVADQAANMSRILALLREIDVVDRDELVHRVLAHAWVGTLATVLEEIAPDQLGRSAEGPQRVQIVVNERDNSLILKGKAHAVAEALRLIDKLDVPETTASAVRVIHLNHADAEPVAQLVEKMVNVETDDGRPLAIIQADVSLNAIIVNADPSTMSRILALVHQLDVRRQQVLIEAAVVEVSINTQDASGIELAAGDASGTTIPLVSTTLNGIVGGLLSRIGETSPEVGIDPVAVASGFASPTIALARLNGDGIAFGAIISALSTDTRANLLSTPSVLTLDNEEATNVSGQQIPFRTGSFTTTTDGASNPFQTISRENVGVDLQVTPHIHDNLSMRMSIRLEVGSVVDSAETGGLGIGAGGFADVVTNTRMLQTTILADDRQIILLGGLIQDDIRDVERKVPLLGDIPIAGRAFRSERKTFVKRHLLVFLRPTVLVSPEDAAQTAEERYQGIYRLQSPESPVRGDVNGVFEGNAG